MMVEDLPVATVDPLLRPPSLDEDPSARRRKRQPNAVAKDIAAASSKKSQWQVWLECALGLFVAGALVLFIAYTLESALDQAVHVVVRKLRNTIIQVSHVLSYPLGLGYLVHLQQRFDARLQGRYCRLLDEDCRSALVLVVVYVYLACQKRTEIDITNNYPFQGEQAPSFVTRQGVEACILTPTLLWIPTRTFVLASRRWKELGDDLTRRKAALRTTAIGVLTVALWWLVCSDFPSTKKKRDSPYLPKPGRPSTARHVANAVTFILWSSALAGILHAGLWMRNEWRHGGSTIPKTIFWTRPRRQE